MINWTKNKYDSLNESHPSHMKIIRYIISGGTAAVVDIGLLYVFTDIMGVWYLLSAVLAFIVAFIVSFSLQKYWTFRDHSMERVGKQGSVYFMVAVANLIVNTLLVYIFTDWFDLYHIFSQILAAGLIAINSFFIYQRFIFKK